MRFIRKTLGMMIQTAGGLIDKVFHNGCDFSKWVEMDDIGFGDDKGNKYQPVFVKVDRKIGKYYTVTKDDSVIDIGCGKGYAMYRLRRLGFGKVGGFDLNTKLVEIANSNFAKLGYDNCHAQQGDAETFDKYDDYNWFFMFNAVPRPVFEKALDNIETSLKRHPREAVLVLANPECHDVVERSSLFETDHKIKGIMSWLDVYCYIANKQ